MNRRHFALPRVWLLTDERQGDILWEAVARLPRGAGVIVRHYTLPRPERAALTRRMVRIASRRRLIVAFSGPEAQARRLGAHAVYGADRRKGALPRLHPVHGRAEVVAAERAGAALLLLSPVFPTRSHPGGRALGPLRFGMLARAARSPVIGLGGMTSNRFRRLIGLGAHGWAAIDGLLPHSQAGKRREIRT